MAVFVLTDARVEVNSVNLSAWVTSVSLDVQAAEVETTSMGDTWQELTGGVKSGSVRIEFNDDFAASAVDATLWPLLGTTTSVKIRPTTSTIGATNPEYQGTALVSQVPALSGSHGELAKKSVTWPTTGTITRATS